MLAIGVSFKASGFNHPLYVFQGIPRFGSGTLSSVVNPLRGPSLGNIVERQTQGTKNEFLEFLTYIPDFSKIETIKALMYVLRVEVGHGCERTNDQNENDNSFQSC